MSNDNRFEEHEVVEGPITFKIWHEYDNDNRPDDYFGDLTNKPIEPYYDMAARVLVLSTRERTEADTEIPFDEEWVYEAYELGDDKAVALPCRYSPYGHGWDRSNSRYVINFQHDPLKDPTTIPYCIQDGERWRGLINQDWYYIGIVVMAYVGNVPITDKYGHAIWGCESDSGADYFKELEQELMGNIKASLKDMVKDLRDRAEIISNAATVLELTLT